MKYILIIFYVHAGGGAGMSAEFNSQDACEAAIVELIARDSDLGKFYNPVCVPKGFSADSTVETNR